MKYGLFIDGGGIRAIVPAYILSVLEQKAGIPLHKAFDVIGGISGGSIVGGGISFGYTGQTMTDLFKNEGDKIFSRNFQQILNSGFGLVGGKFDVEKFQKILTQYYGPYNMSQLETTFITGAYCMTTGKPKIFKSDQDTDIPVFKAVSASCAAPTYFDPVKIDHLEYCDGGVFASNPGMIGYAEMVNRFPGEEICILSLGTGSRQKGYTDVHKWFKFKWIKPLIDIMMAADSDVVDYELRQIAKTTSQLYDYTRITDQLPDYVNSEMSDASKKNISALLRFAQELALKYDKELTELGSKLKAHAALQG